MKVFKKLLFSITAIAAFVGTTCAMEQPDKYVFENYSKQFTPDDFKKYQVSPELKLALDQRFEMRNIIHNQGINSTRRFTLNNQTYFAKLDTSRIIGTQLINELAQEYGLKIKAPFKSIYESLNGKEYVIVPETTSVQRPFSLAQIQDIYKAIQVSLYQDTHGGNLLNTQEGIVYFIDTQGTSFSRKTEWNSQNQALTLDILKATVSMTDEAKAWLSKKIEQITVPSC